MPFTSKQKRAAFAELGNRKKGGGGKMFGGMSDDKLKDYAHSPLEKKKGKKKGGRGGKFTASDQAAALRAGGK